MFFFKVSRYEVKYSTNIDELNDHFDRKNHSKITEQNVVGGSFKPVKVGSIQSVVASVPFRNDVTYFVALRAIDKAGKKSSVSNIAQFYLAPPLMTESSEEEILSVDVPSVQEKFDEDPVVGSSQEDAVPDEVVPEEIVELILEIQEEGETQRVDVPASTEEEPSHHVTSTSIYVISTLSAVSVIVVVAAITRKIYRSQYRQYKNVPV